MDDAFHSVLAEYDARADAEATLPYSLETRDERLLWVGRAGAQLLHTLAVGAGAQRILELGTSYGYSTLWLAEAARRAGGRVVSLDIAPQKQAYAKAMLAKAGLDGFVAFETGDALEIIPRLAGPFDFVFLDIWKELYVPSIGLLAPKLAPGGYLIADNMIEPAYWRDDILKYRRAVRALPGMSSVLVSVGSGLEISRLAGPLDEGL